MAGQNTAVFGIYRDREGVERAIDILRGAGFRNTDISVHCDNPDWVKRAKDILKETGAEDIASAGEASADFATSDKPMPRRATRPVEDRPAEIKRDLPPGPRTVDKKLDDTVELEDPL